MFGKKIGQVILALTTVAFLTVNAIADNINVNGTTRNMIVYAPPGIEKNRPLIIQMHGMNQDAPFQQNAAKWEPIADTARIVVVFPNGEGKAWDISGDKDVNFLKAIINEMYNKYGIDKNRVYVSGFSMGGMMSYHAANKMGDMIAAIAPVSGYPIGDPAPSSKRPMPIIHTHGTTDDVVNYNSGVNHVKKWVSFNNCSSNSQVTKPYPANRPNSAAYLEVWSGCSDGVEVRLMSITGKGHWYSTDEASVHTSVEIWNFVKNFSLDGSTITPPIVVPVDRDSIFNGDFESNTTAWDLQLHGDGKGIGEVKDGKYVLDVSAIGTENYQVQLIQHDLHLEKDQWYEISFDASAAAVRPLEVNVEQHTDPWASYLQEKQNFEISTEIQTYSFKFQMTAETDTNSRLSFNAGGAIGTLTLDNVKLKKIDPSAEVPEGLAKTLHMNIEGINQYSVFGMNGRFLGQISADKGSLYDATQKLVKRPGMYLLKSQNGNMSLLKVKF